MKSPATARNRSPLARGIGHRTQMQVGDVAHVDHAESSCGRAGMAAVHHSLKSWIEVEYIRPERGPEHHRRD